MNLKFTNDVTAINRSRLLAGVCGIALINLLYIPQAFAAPLILNDGLSHDVNTFVEDGISLSNNTTLNIQSGASISKSDALGGKAIDSDGSTINMSGGRIKGSVSQFGIGAFNMSGGEIQGEAGLFGSNAMISGGTIDSVFSDGARVDISGGTFGDIVTIAGAYEITGGTFRKELNVGVVGRASMAIKGGDFSGDFSYGFNPEDDTAFTFYGDLSLSATPTLIIDTVDELIYETIISGTLIDGTKISQTITCDDFVSRNPCGAVAIVLPLWGEISIELAKYKVSENGSSITLTVNRVDGSEGEVSVDFATSDGTATASTDYKTASGTLSFADGETSQAITINLLDDSVYEGNETFTVVLNNVQGGAILGLTSALITINENDPAPSPGAFQFGKASYSVTENGSSVSVAVQRVGGSSGDVSVGFSTTDGTATANVDYTPVSKVLTFANGVTSNTITVSLIDDATYEGNEAFAVNLSNPVGGATLGGVSTAQVVIKENDPVPASGVIQFDSASYNPSENVNSVSVRVERVNGSFGAVTVDYNTADITAAARLDYQSISGTLTFAAGETSKVINVSLLDDDDYEGTETFALELSNAQGGATLGTVSSKQIAIAENDPAPPAGVLQFSGESYNPNENDGSIVVTVIRMNGSFGAVSVNYNTTDLTATAGEDYQPVNGTLTFSAGETSQIIDIPLLNDDVYEGDEAFTVALSNVKGGAIAGGISSAQIDIIEDDSAPSAGVIQFSGKSFSDEESAARVLVTVTRKNFDPDYGEVSVNYSTGDLTATARQDYRPTSGTLIFKDGEDNKTIGVPLIDDNIDEGEEVFTIVLSDAKGEGAEPPKLGTPSGATIKIIEDDVGVSAGTSDNGISSSGGGGAIHPLYLLSLIGYFLLFPGRRRK